MRAEAAVEDEWVEAIGHPTGSFDHPIKISPDWPPKSDLDFSIHGIKLKYPPGPSRTKLIWQILKRYGYQPDWFERKDLTQ